MISKFIKCHYLLILTCLAKSLLCLTIYDELVVISWLHPIMEYLFTSGAFISISNLETFETIYTVVGGEAYVRYLGFLVYIFDCAKHCNQLVSKAFHANINIDSCVGKY